MTATPKWSAVLVVGALLFAHESIPGELFLGLGFCLLGEDK